jgi:tetratricopeptide (TPR) repeat protein
MKKLLVALMLISGIQVFAQKSKVESAALYLRNGEVEDAKKAIDQAVEHPDTKDDPKAWFYYTSVYDTIYRNPAYAALATSDLVDKFFNGCKKCIELDAKERYTYYCKEQAIINSAFWSYDKGSNAYEAKDFAGAIKYYKMALDVIPYDKNGDLKKNNLSDKNIYLYMAYAAVQADDNVNAKIYLQKLMDLNYEDHIIHMQMVNIYLGEKDTITALSFMDKARAKFPNEKDLINQELNIYLAQGRLDILLEKLNAAIDLNNEDHTLIYVRGNVFDNFANDALKKYKHERDTSSSLKKRALTEKSADKKAKYNAASNSFLKSAETNQKISKENAVKAEVDYLKVIELNPDYIDAYFNLGAMSNNKSTEIVEKINNITATTQTEYDKKYKPLKQKQDSILTTALGYFSRALEIAETKADDTPEKKKDKNAYMRDILYSMQQVYANLGNEKKTIEMKKRREELE